MSQPAELQARVDKLLLDCPDAFREEVATLQRTLGETSTLPEALAILKHTWDAVAKRDDEEWLTRIHWRNRNVDVQGARSKRPTLREAVEGLMTSNASSEDLVTLVRYAQLEVFEALLRAIDGEASMPPFANQHWKVFRVDPETDQPIEPLPGLLGLMHGFDDDPVRNY